MLLTSFSDDSERLHPTANASAPSLATGSLALVTPSCIGKASNFQSPSHSQSGVRLHSPVRKGLTPISSPGSLIRVAYIRVGASYLHFFKHKRLRSHTFLDRPRKLFHPALAKLQVLPLQLVLHMMCACCFPLSLKFYLHG